MKGEILEYGFGKLVHDFRAGTAFAMPPSMGQMVSIDIVEGPSEMKGDTIVSINLISGRDILPGKEFTITICVKEDSIHSSVNRGPFQSHALNIGRSTEAVLQPATVWVSGIYQLTKIDAIIL